MHAETAPRTTPTSRMTLHVTRSTRVVGKISGRRNYCGKNPPNLPAHRSGPSPTMHHAYVWPRPGGSYRCTKVGALLLHPFTCEQAGRATPTAAVSRAEEGSQSTRRPKQRQDRRRKESKKARWTPPRQDPCRGGFRSLGKILAGATCLAPAEHATLEPKRFLRHIGTKA